MAKKISLSLVAILLIIPFVFNLMSCTDNTLKPVTLSVINDNGVLTVNYSTESFGYDLANGRYFIKRSESFIVEGVTAEFKDSDQLYELKNYDSDKRTYESNEIIDAIGKGVELVVTSAGNNSIPDIIQTFKFYEHESYFLLYVTLRSNTDRDISSNYSSPFLLDNDSNGASIFKLDSTCVLKAPFDNDTYKAYETFEYTSIKQAVPLFSSEFSIIYDPVELNTLLLGSVEHTTYKTGIEVGRNDLTRLNTVNLYAGATNETTRDFHYYGADEPYVMPHGAITANSVSSAVMMIGYFNNYTKALEKYGDVNAIFQPALEWEHGVPVGWNSWNGYGMDLSYEKLIDSADFLKNEMPYFSNNGRTYVNLDSYYNLGDGHTKTEVAQHIINNGQTPGTYNTPYTYWASPTSDNLAYSPPSTNGLYTIRDMVVKDHNDNPLIISKHDKEALMVLDPTHPGTKMYIDAVYSEIIRDGFEYVKLDFLSNVSVEGKFYDKSITTGIQAYNYGMKYIKDLLSYENTGRDIFISYSIAPIFPGGLAHSRRISCDAFGGIFDTIYMLNSLTFSWWLSGRVYKYNDPDHTTLYKYMGNADVPSSVWSEREAIARYNASIIAGTVLLLSDDYQLEGAQSRTKDIVSNTALLDLALKGVTFTPLRFPGNTTTRYMAANVYYMFDGLKWYVGIFNLGLLDTEVSFDLSQTGVPANSNGKYTLKSLNSGLTIEVGSVVSINFSFGESEIYEVS
ncbi:MAG: hypothetical protein LBE09_06685 [Christensenellaceae bacterium]|jgi:hypothetical protein|nr:hypothetical protein [Christensenellaceae bacterium]